MKKRILIFSTAYLPLIGGAEVAVKEITDRLSDFEFVMITARLDNKLPAKEKIGNIEVHRLGRGDNQDKYRLIFCAWKKARELGKFDVVWSIMASYAGFAALRFKKRNPSVPFLLTLQEGDSRFDIYKHVWWCWPYFTKIFKRADKIQAISSYLAKWAKDLGAACPIEVVPNGVDATKFPISQFLPAGRQVQFPINDQSQNTPSFPRRRESGGQLSKEFGIKGNDKVIITISRLVKKNGVSDLIKSMKFLNDNTLLLILGTGELEGKLKLESQQEGIEKRVRFLGNICHDDLPRYLQISDVFCRPSLSEGLGNVFLEAMAAGVPIVGTKIGGIPDFLRDGETGLFCVNDPRDIAKKIKMILDDQELRSRLIVNGKKIVEEKYSWKLVSEKMKNIFNNLCAS